MGFKADIGIIGAMRGEVEKIIELLEEHSSERRSGIDFHTGRLFGRPVVVAMCGIGKVFAAVCAQAMVMAYSPRLLVNTGVGGALDRSLSPLDLVVADKLVQHDMDTSPLGDPKGLVSGINKIYFECDKRAVSLLTDIAKERGVRTLVGTVATGDRFISEGADKEALVRDFGASACEMEGCAVAQVAYINETPVAVVRAISDSADGSASLDYAEFLSRAEEISTALTLELVRRY